MFPKFFGKGKLQIDRFFATTSTNQETQALIANRDEIKTQEAPTRYCSYIATGISATVTATGIGLIAADNDVDHTAALDLAAIGTELTLLGSVILLGSLCVLMYSCCRQKSRESLFDKQLENGIQQQMSNQRTADLRL